MNPRQAKKEAESGRAALVQVALDSIERFVWVDLDGSPAAQSIDVARLVEVGALAAEDAPGKRAYRMGKSAGEALAGHIADALMKAIGLGEYKP